MTAAGLTDLDAPDAPRDLGRKFLSAQRNALCVALSFKSLSVCHVRQGKSRFSTTVTTVPGRTVATEEISSKVVVCEKAKHHTKLFCIKLYKLYIVTALAQHIVQQIQ